MTKDRELFWQLLQPEYTRAMMFCRKLTGHRERGDDLFQDALVTALTGFDKLRDQKAFRPWLYRILVNSFRSRVRRPWWKRLTTLTADTELTLSGKDPVEAHTARRWLDRAFQVLSTEDQALVTLHELEGWPVVELAEMFGRSEGAVKAKLFRARRKMKNALIEFSERNRESENRKPKDGNKRTCVAVKPNTD